MVHVNFLIIANNETSKMFKNNIFTLFKCQIKIILVITCMHRDTFDNLFDEKIISSIKKEKQFSVQTKE